MPKVARKRTRKPTPKRPSLPSSLERSFLYYWRVLASDLPEPEREVKFLARRKFRFDFAFPRARIAIELEGGVHSGGRHVRGAGYTTDCEKYNLATLAGWKVLRFTSTMLKNDPETCITQVRLLLGG